ncbi:hypothetical protein CI238_11590, partial [Colletotrichum incanum]
LLLLHSQHVTCTQNSVSQNCWSRNPSRTQPDAHPPAQKSTNPLSISIDNQLTETPQQQLVKPPQWERFTDRWRVPERSSLRPPRLSPRRRRRPPRAARRSVSHTPAASSTSPSLVASAR